MIVVIDVVLLFSGEVSFDVYVLMGVFELLLGWWFLIVSCGLGKVFGDDWCCFGWVMVSYLIFVIEGYLLLCLGVLS